MLASALFSTLPLSLSAAMTNGNATMANAVVSKFKEYMLTINQSALRMPKGVFAR
jgi:hypothetical protein